MEDVFVKVSSTLTVTILLSFKHEYVSSIMSIMFR